MTKIRALVAMLVLVTTAAAPPARAERGAPAAARKPPRVLVLDTDEHAEPAGFFDELRIQLAGNGHVVRGPTLPATTSETRVLEAERLCRKHQATLAVWLERSPESDVLLYVVGTPGGVEVFSLPGSDEIDTPRALALKVGGVLDRVLAGQPAGESVALAPVAAPPAPVATSVVADPTVRRGGRGRAPGARRWLVELAVGGAPGAATASEQAWLRAGVGLRWPDRRAPEVVLTIARPASVDLAFTPGTVSVSELDVGASARASWPVGRGGLRLGGELGVGVRGLDAVGRTTAGASGEDLLFVPVAGGALEARWPLGRSLELRGALGGELMLRRMHLQVNRQEVAETGRARATATFSLVLLMR
jgi:hypothetical protein